LKFSIVHSGTKCSHYSYDYRICDENEPGEAKRFEKEDSSKTVKGDELVAVNGYYGSKSFSKNSKRAQ
ncbi:MAG: hypothetical protein ACW960_07040, partial [Candidatus Thorarchaeota archaeon]